MTDTRTCDVCHKRIDEHIGIWNLEWRGPLTSHDETILFCSFTCLSKWSEQRSATAPVRNNDSDHVYGRAFADWYVRTHSQPRN